jgi:hypothetical protein
MKQWYKSPEERQRTSYIHGNIQNIKKASGYPQIHKEQLLLYVRYGPKIWNYSFEYGQHRGGA